MVWENEPRKIRKILRKCKKAPQGLYKAVAIGELISYRNAVYQSTGDPRQLELARRCYGAKIHNLEKEISRLVEGKKNFDERHFAEQFAYNQ